MLRKHEIEAAGMVHLAVSCGFFTKALCVCTLDLKSELVWGGSRFVDTAMTSTVNRQTACGVHCAFLRYKTHSFEIFRLNHLTLHRHQTRKNALVVA
jgi:hypothetical protein